MRMNIRRLPISCYYLKERMDFTKIKEWVRTFAEKNDIWFQTYDEIPGLSIEDMQTSYIEGKMFIDINRFHDIKVGYFEYFKSFPIQNAHYVGGNECGKFHRLRIFDAKWCKEPFEEEEEEVSVEERPFFIWRISDYKKEEDLYTAILLEIKKYMLVVS